MSDGKIYITITDARTGEVVEGTDVTVPKKPDEKETKKKNDFLKHQMWHFVESEARQMAQYSLGNIGNFTGDYNTQRQVNFAMSALGTVKNIGLAALYGGAPGFAIAVASTVVNFGLQLHSENVAIKKQNHSINQLRQLSGLDGLTNGSRI